MTTINLTSWKPAKFCFLAAYAAGTYLSLFKTAIASSNGAKYFVLSRVLNRLGRLSGQQNWTAFLGVVIGASKFSRSFLTRLDSGLAPPRRHDSVGGVVARNAWVGFLYYALAWYFRISSWKDFVFWLHECLSRFSWDALSHIHITHLSPVHALAITVVYVLRNTYIPLPTFHVFIGFHLHWCEYFPFNDTERSLSCSMIHVHGEHKYFALHQEVILPTLWSAYMSRAAVSSDLKIARTNEEYRYAQTCTQGTYMYLYTYSFTGEMLH